MSAVRNKYYCYKAVADEYGFNAAILFTYIENWCGYHRKNGVKQYDGKYWMFASMEGFKSAFPCLGRRQIQTALGKLIEGGLIEKERIPGGPGGNIMSYCVTAKGAEIALNISPNRNKSQRKSPESEDDDLHKTYSTKRTNDVQNVPMTDTERTNGTSQNVPVKMYEMGVSSYSIYNTHCRQHYNTHNKDDEGDENEKVDEVDVGNPFGDDDGSLPPDTVYRYASDNLISMGYRAMQELSSFVDDLSEAVVRHAIDNALDSGIRTWAYVKTVLNSYADANINTVAQAKAFDEDFKRRRGDKPTNNRKQKQEHESTLFGDFY